MESLTARYFLKVALQRLTGAEEIMDKLRLTLEAHYIGGYAVECSLKALILSLTPSAEREGMIRQLTRGAINHDTEHLRGLLKGRGLDLPLELVKRMRRLDGTTDLRYGIGRRDTGETRAFLNTARAIFDWAEQQTP